MNKLKTIFLRVQVIQGELCHYLSLYKNAVFITLIINHTYINTALQLDAAKYAACTLALLCYQSAQNKKKLCWLEDSLLQ